MTKTLINIHNCNVIGQDTLLYYNKVEAKYETY